MTYVQIILKAAKVAHTSGMILLAICTHETKLRTIVVENDGGTPTYGICQVKHETAKMLGFTGQPQELLVPTENAKWAAKYLKYQHDRYGDWCKAVAAYNAGRYNESKIMPGHPRNLKYVVHVRKILIKSSTERLTCDRNYIEGEYAQNNGPGLRIQSTK